MQGYFTLLQPHIGFESFCTSVTIFNGQAPRNLAEILYYSSINSRSRLPAVYGL